METVFPPESGHLEAQAEPGVEWVDGQLQPSRSASEAMSSAVDGALEMVLALVADECADRATRRVLLRALAGTVDHELRRLDSESGAPGRTGSEIEAASPERKAALTALQYRIAAMPDTVLAAARQG